MLRANYKSFIISWIILLFSQCDLFSQTLRETIDASEKIHFVKMMPAKILVQFMNYNQSPNQYEPDFLEKDIKLFDILTYKSSFGGEMKFIFEQEIQQQQVDEINNRVLDYISEYIDRDKILVVFPDHFQEEHAVNSVYFQVNIPRYIYVEHTNDMNFHYLTMNSFKADFGINLYEVPLGKKKKKIASSEGGAPVLRKMFGAHGQADNLQKAEATKLIIDEYFYNMSFDLDWHFARFKKDFEKYINK